MAFQVEVDPALEFTHRIPQLDAGVARHIPVIPAQVFLTEDRQGIFIGVCQEGGCPGMPRLVDQFLWIGSVLGQFLARAQDQQVTLLRIAHLVVDLFAGQDQHALAPVVMISIDAIHIDIVIGDQDGIQTRHAWQRGPVRNAWHSHRSRWNEYAG